MADRQSTAQAQAQQAARLGETFIELVRAGVTAQLEPLFKPASSAALYFEMFGAALFRLDLRLDDPREQGQLAPYDLQIEQDLALLELGVITNHPLAGQATAGPGHLFRQFGSGLVLSRAEPPQAEFGWLIEEVLPLNADGRWQPGDPTDERILAVHQGQAALPLWSARLGETVSRLLSGLQCPPGRFNLEEQLNALRLWQDYRQAAESTADEVSGPAIAAIEYLISLFDYHTVDLAALAERTGENPESITDQAREITSLLRVTQFDDKYSIHPDPVAHYRQLFGELGIDPRRDEAIRQAAGNSIFDSIEVPPDDDTFFGPG